MYTPKTHPPLHRSSDSIILSMQIHLIPPRHTPYRPLQLSNRIADIHSHPRRPTHKHTRASPSPLLTHFLQHERYIRSSILGTPTALARLYSSGQERESHEILLELGGCAWETKIKVCLRWCNRVFEVDWCGWAGQGDGHLLRFALFG